MGSTTNIKEEEVRIVSPVTYKLDPDWVMVKDPGQTMIRLSGVVSKWIYDSKRHTVTAIISLTELPITGP